MERSYLELVEKRDLVEKEKKLSDMVTHIYELTHALLHLQKECSANDHQSSTSPS